MYILSTHKTLHTKAQMIPTYTKRVKNCADKLKKKKMLECYLKIIINPNTRLPTADYITVIFTCYNIIFLQCMNCKTSDRMPQWRTDR